MLEIRKGTDVRIVIPVATARLLCERAEERWHQRAGVVVGASRTTIQVWPPRNAMMGMGIAPIGSFTMVWGAPRPEQATITRIEWDDHHGGNESAIRGAINTLAGWPIANDSTRSRVAKPLRVPRRLF